MKTSRLIKLLIACTITLIVFEVVGEYYAVNYIEMPALKEPDTMFD